MSQIASFRNLVVWQKGMQLAERIYQLTQGMPRAEEYRLKDQLLRAAISIPSNVAEGHARGARKDYARFVSVSRGSVAELDTLLELCVRAGALSQADVIPIFALSEEVGRMPRVLRDRLEPIPDAKVNRRISPASDLEPKA